MVMPRTHNGRAALQVLSAMQKFIRRGMEREAMLAAVEIAHTSKRYLRMVTNRLELISHEDIGIGDPTVIPFVHTCCVQAHEWHDPNKPGKWRMAIGSAIRVMCRCRKKSREGDHFQAAIGIANQMCGVTVTIPDYANDMHTVAGHRAGRGLEHFRKEGAQLNPPPLDQDAYEDDCYLMWDVRDEHIEPDDSQVAGMVQRWRV